MLHKRFTSLLLTLATVFTLSVSAFAATSTTATVPVTLTVDNEFRAVNVSVPASLPIHIKNGTVIVADNARITNNAKNGAVQVTGVQVTNGAYKVGSYEQFSGKQTIALKINGCTTVKSGNLSINNTAFPVIKGGQQQPLTYFAKVSKDAPNSKDVNAANVIFTISIVD